MPKNWFALPLLLMAALPAMADGAPEQAAVAAGSMPAHVRLKQQVRAHDAEVTRLQRQLVAEESQSRQASERLQKQNSQIAQLQRQLAALLGERREARAGL